MAVSGRARINDDKGLFFLCSVVEWVELRGKDFLLGFASKNETWGIIPRPLETHPQTVHPICFQTPSGILSTSVVQIRLLYALASLVAQLVKNPPAMQKTPVQSLGGEDPLEKG